MTVLCVIGARGGSQGLPGKNIKDLADFLDSVSYSAFTMNDLQKNINILEVKNRIDLVFKQNQ